MSAVNYLFLIGDIYKGTSLDLFHVDWSAWLDKKEAQHQLLNKYSEWWSWPNEHKFVVTGSESVIPDHSVH